MSDLFDTGAASPGHGAISLVVDRYRRAAIDDLAFIQDLERLGFSTTDALKYVRLIRSTLDDHRMARRSPLRQGSSDA